MPETNQILFNEFVAIEKIEDYSVSAPDSGLQVGEVKKISLFVSQVAEGDVVLYKKLYTYIEDGNPFDIATQSDIILRKPAVEALP